MSKEQEEHYLEVLDRFLKQVDEYLPSTLYKLFNALQLVSSGVKILSASNEKMKNERFFKNPSDNPRIKSLVNLIGENGENEKYIIFCKYTHDIFDIERALKEKFGDDSAVMFYGGLLQSQRQNNIIKFKNQASFFIANKLCAGYGLNL